MGDGEEGRGRWGDGEEGREVVGERQEWAGGVATPKASVSTRQRSYCHELLGQNVEMLGGCAVW